MALTCRTCGKPLTQPLGKLGPFCSERCRLMDLGAWADGSYRVPDEPVSAEEAEESDPAPKGPNGRTLH